MAAAAVMIFVRVVAAPRGWLPTVPEWEPAFWTALIGLAAMLVVWVLCRICKAPAATVDHRQLASVSTISILCGAAMLFCTLFEGWSFVVSGQTPPPNNAIINGMDKLLLFLMWGFAALGGVFLICLGFSWLTRYISYHGRWRLWALTPMLWAWMRLARYMVSYSSTVNVEKNISEFLMLIFTLLFFFSFARYVGAVGDEKKTSPMLMFYACGAFLFSITAAVTRLAWYWDGKLEGSLPQMASAADLAVALLALAVAVAVAFTRRNETVFERVRKDHPEWLQATEDAPESDVMPPVVSESVGTDAEIPAEAPTEVFVEENGPVDTAQPVSDIDSILKEIYKDDQNSAE